jgi:hypothetical protein
MALQLGAQHGIELETLPSSGAIRVVRYVCRSFLHITTDHLCVQDGVSAP